MQMYWCLPIALPVTEEDLTKYKTVRLLALQTDPRSFGSTYEREVQFSIEQWRGRIQTDQVITIAARCNVPQYSEGAATVEHWVGIASILTPRLLQALQVFPPVRQPSEDLEVYVLVGMWVRPQDRRKGLGTKLIEAGVDVAQKDASEKKRKLLMLEVYDSNESGKSLYLNSGFTLCEGSGGEIGRVWMERLISTS